MIGRCALMNIRIFNYVNFHGCQKCYPIKSFHLQPSAYSVYEKDRKGGYKTEIKRPVQEVVKTGLNDLNSEVKLFAKEWKVKMEADLNFMIEDGDYMMFWRFENQKSIEPWIVTSDKDHGEGKSEANLTLSKGKKALFHGYVDTEPPKDGVITKAGYCNIRSPRNRKSFQRFIPYDWEDFTHLIIRYRGDGRPYLLNISMDMTFDITWNDVFSYYLFTRGGPYWQVAKIPFSKFFRGSKGRIQDKQEKILLHRVQHFSITCSEQIAGPFQLEIDYMALFYDENHTEKFAYEMYETPKWVVGSSLVQ